MKREEALIIFDMIRELIMKRDIEPLDYDKYGRKKKFADHIMNIFEKIHK